jgi:hypothetical protein
MVPRAHRSVWQSCARGAAAMRKRLLQRTRVTRRVATEPPTQAKNAAPIHPPIQRDEWHGITAGSIMSIPRRKWALCHE